MTVEDYKRIYEELLELSDDADAFDTFENITDEGVAKCKYIAAMLEVLHDVPLTMANHILKYKNVEFDYEEVINDKVF